jgi:hypothetical protein
VKLKGYSIANQEQSEIDRYNEAKKPFGRERTFIDREAAQGWVAKHKGWYGAMVPPGYILVDIDNPESGELVYNRLEKASIKFLGIRTPNGWQFLFKDARRLENQKSKQITLSGIVCDYRISGKGYIVLPSEETPGRYFLHCDDELDPMPLMFQPVRTFNPEKDNELLPLPIYDGGRDDILFRHACRIRAWNEKHKLELSRGDILEALQEINEIFGEPPKPYYIVEQKLKSAENYGNDTGNEHAYDENRDFDISKALIKGTDLIARDIKIEWAIENLLPMQAISLCPAKAGTGKTTIAMQMCNAVVSGMPFFDLPTVKLPIVYIDYENPIAITRERVIKTAAHDVLIWHTTNPIPPPKIDGKEWVLYQKLPPNALIVFDTLRTAQSGDENDSKHMSFVMQRFMELRNMGYTILILHHTPKTNDQIYKGSTCIFDLSDHVLGLHKVKRGTDRELDDVNHEDACYRFGTKDKTRYKPFQFFLEFDTERGIFVQTKDRTTGILESIRELIRKHQPVKQTILFDIAKDSLNIRSKQKFLGLLRKGVNRYWKTNSSGRSVLYTVIE